MKKNKRVCHIVFERFPADERVRRYCTILVQKEFDVHVVCIRGEKESAYEFLNGMHIHRLPLRKKRGTFLRRFYEYILFQFLCFYKVSILHIKHKFTFCHIHTLPDFLVFSTLIPKLSGTKIILDFHELFPEYMMQFSNLERNSIVVKIITLFENISFRFANQIITFHDPAKEILQKRISAKKNITTIMNSIDPEEMIHVEKEFVPEFNLIYHGTINYNLNLSIVIDALKIIQDKYPNQFQNITFQLYGEGPDLETILKKAEKLSVRNIKYHGWIPYSDMYKELGKASVLVLPPLDDVYSKLYYSGKLVDSIYLKIPVIASRLDTYSFYYPENCINYFTPGSIEELAEKIIYVYNNPEEVKIKTETAFQRYQLFSWPVMKKRYIELIGNIVQ